MSASFSGNMIYNFIKKFITILLIVALSPLVFWNDTAKAAVTADTFVTDQIFNNIVSNRDFIDINSMSANDIQQFLAGKSSYLKDFSEGDRSAAQIIYDAAQGKKFTYARDGQDYSTMLGETYKSVLVDENTGTVSPKVLLVMLQKEQSLITKTDRDDTALTIAMGYGCPDSSACSNHYFGFTFQVEWAAWQLRYNYERAQGKGADFQVGQTMNGVDGQINVTFLNAATASLYRYTPHVFDSAFNFYNLYDGWFTPHEDTTINDTTNFTLKAYEIDQQVSGSKNANTIAYLGNIAIPGAGLGSTGWTVNFNDLASGVNNYTVDYKDANGTTVASKSITIEIHKAGDINGDNNIDVQDLSIFASYWNQINPEEPLANLTGVVGHAIDVQDLSILAGYWGK